MVPRLNKDAGAFLYVPLHGFRENLCNKNKL